MSLQAVCGPRQAISPPEPVGSCYFTGEKDLKYACTDLKRVSKDLPSPAAPSQDPGSLRGREVMCGEQNDHLACQQGAGDLITLDRLFKFSHSVEMLINIDLDCIAGEKEARRGPTACPVSK